MNKHSVCHNKRFEASLLAYEQSILLGRLHRDEEALRLLALTLHDANSAEAYCSQGGAVLSPYMAIQIASSLSSDGAEGIPPSTLTQYAQLVKLNADRADHRQTIESKKDTLLKTLLAVYMTSDASSEHISLVTPTAHLLNTQALHLTTSDILPSVPPSWPLSTLCTG